MKEGGGMGCVITGLGAAEEAFHHSMGKGRCTPGDQGNECMGNGDPHRVCLWPTSNYLVFSWSFSLGQKRRVSALLSVTSKSARVLGECTWRPRTVG